MQTYYLQYESVHSSLWLFTRSLSDVTDSRALTHLQGLRE